MQFSHVTKISAVWAENVAFLLVDVAYFIRSLNQKCLSDTAKCGMIVGKWVVHIIVHLGISALYVPYDMCLLSVMSSKNKNSLI